MVPGMGGGGKPSGISGGRIGGGGAPDSMAATALATSWFIPCWGRKGGGIGGRPGGATRQVY